MRRFKKTRPRHLVALVSALAVMAVAAPAFAVTADSGARAIKTPANYNGHEIDLAVDWEGASACLVAPDDLVDIECFDSEAELIDRVKALGLDDAPAAVPEGLRSLQSYQCSDWLKLYDGTWYGGTSIWFRSRGLWQNLDWYGFNQRVSSFNVGACQTIFADFGGGGGQWYPLALSQPWDVDAVLLSGWDNDFSSFYIY